jgi:hypothetical protein
VESWNMLFNSDLSQYIKGIVKVKARNENQIFYSLTERSGNKNAFPSEKIKTIECKSYNANEV